MVARRGETSGRTVVALALVLTMASSCSASPDESAPEGTTSAVGSDDPADGARAMVRCLTERGVAAEVSGAGDGFTADEGALERKQLMAIIEECEDLTGAGDIPPRQLGRDEIEAVYGRWLDAATCIEEQGYEVTPAPSLETFVDSWSSGPWNPYVDLGPLPDGEFDRLNALCPQ